MLFKAYMVVPESRGNRGKSRSFAQDDIEKAFRMTAGKNNYPKASSSADSSGVPQTRQMTAEQSPQTRGSSTSLAQLGHHRRTSLPAGGFGDCSSCILKMSVA